MTEPQERYAKAARDWWVALGMTVTALAAVVSSFTGLRSLAAATGWRTAQPHRPRVRSCSESGLDAEATSRCGEASPDHLTASPDRG